MIRPVGRVLDSAFYGRGMISIPIGAAWRPYVRALADSGFDVASVGAWVAAAELSPARRRLARGALAAVTVAVAIPGVRAARSAAADTAEPVAPGARSGLPFVDAGIRLPADELSEAGTPTRRRAVLVAGVLTTAVAVSVGAAAAGRQLERRWLARLARNGHPHPHRALAVRMAGLYAVMVVPSRLFTARLAAQADRRDAGSAAGD